VQLRNDNALRTVDDESASLRHIWDCAEIDILHNDSKVLVLVIGTIELQLRLEWHTVCQATLQTLLNGVTRRINVVIEELEYEVISCVGDWEVLLKNAIETLVLAVLCGGIHLEEIPE
jgi:hypothetical protein